MNHELLKRERYNAEGQLIDRRYYQWLGLAPVAVIDIAAGTDTPVVTYIHTDHLATPRMATNQAGKVIWEWRSSAFGEGTPNEDVDGDGTNFSLNLRFPGQYYDAESGLHYNLNRYYDPNTGRYLESDPIGLKGGLNTYAYVGGNPVNFVDPLGLQGLDPRNSTVMHCLQNPMWCLKNNRDLYKQCVRGKKSGISGKEGAKNVPDYAKEYLGPLDKENGKSFAKRVMDDKFGPGGWGNDRGPGSDFSQIKKWADRSFEKRSPNIDKLFGN